VSNAVTPAFQLITPRGRGSEERDLGSEQDRCEVVAAGEGIHFAQEDEPEAVSRIVGEWRRHML
jgi:hypothetical protein